MTELDPYAVLGVSPTASRAEIARAYRALARRHHPDAGAAPNATMAALNDAWHVVSDPVRRAAWDRRHTAVEPPHWRPAPVDLPRRPPPVADAPPSRMDSPWVAIGVIGAIAIVVAGLMIGITLLSAGPEPVRYRFTSRDMELEYPDGWTQARGVAGQPAAHRIIVHLVSYYLPPADMCTAFGEPCSPAPEEIPNGESSVTIVAYEGGTPPEPEPLISRPFGLDADAMIGGQAAAMDRRPAGDGRTMVWWQLSPPGFPDRWIEVNAIVADRNLEESAVLAEVEEMLETLEFRSP